MTENENVKFDLSNRQSLAFHALEGADVEELLYGGAKGGGKSVFGCIWSYYKAKQLIKRFDLQTRKYPLVVGFMGRKQSVDFNTTTLETWKRFIPADAYELKKYEKLIVIEGKVALRYGGLDDTDTVNKFNSAEFAFFFIDQAEEISEQDMGLLRGTLRLKIKDTPLEYKALLTANPAICWLKPAFISTPQPLTKFIRALPTDNPFLPDGYIPRLRKAFSFRPELLKAYLEGSWDDLDTAFVVIPYRTVERNVHNEQYDKAIIRKITVCDVSGEGDDECVIYDFINNKIVNAEIYCHRDLMDTTGRLQAHAKQNGSNMICVDKVGEGAGVVARLIEIYANDPSMTIYGFDGRVKAIDPDTYANYKTEAWFKAARKFQENKCDLPNDQILMSQLSSVTYHYKSNEKLAIDSKDKLKEKLRHSPDRADAYIMGLDALDRVIPLKKKDPYEMFTRPDADYPFNPNTV